MNELNLDNFNEHLSTYGESFTPDTELALRSLHKRIVTAPKQTATVRLLRPRLWWGIAGALVLGIIGFTLLRDSSMTISNHGVEMMAVALPDGTEVLLQQGSEIHYDASFDEFDRRVDLKGQAYFQVHKDKNRPFIVERGGTKLLVTGTAFNLRVTTEEMEVEVSEGSVNLTHDGKTIPVKARQCGLAVVGKPATLMPAVNLNRHAWRTDTLVFQNTRLTEAIKTIQHNYGYTVSGLPEDCDFTFSGTYTDVDPVAVLETVAALGGGELVTGADKRVLRFDGECR